MEPIYNTGEKERVEGRTKRYIYNQFTVWGEVRKILHIFQ